MRIFVFESMEMVLKIIAILWGGGIKLCNYFYTFAVKYRKYICKNIESPFLICLNIKYEENKASARAI